MGGVVVYGSIADERYEPFKKIRAVETVLVRTFTLARS
jgi:hypothetical protein